MPNLPPLMIFFQFVSKKIDLGQKLPLRGQISPTKFIILWQNFYVYAPKSIKTHCFLTYDTHRKILILLQRKKFCPKTTLKTPTCNRSLLVTLVTYCSTWQPLVTVGVYRHCLSTDGHKQCPLVTPGTSQGQIQSFFHVMLGDFSVDWGIKKIKATKIQLKRGESYRLVAG